MIVSSKKTAPSRKIQGGQPTIKMQAQGGRMPAPLRGLVFDEPISEAQPGGAKVLDNWIVGLNTVRVRKGYSKHATIATDTAQSIFTYNVASGSKVFAASDDSIFDITSPADPAVIPSAAVSGQANGLYSTAQFGTAGGDFLYVVNGADNPQLYDGSTWTEITGVSSPAITGVTPANLSHVWSFANRLFFVEKDTMLAWYLPVDSIGGAASSFSLAGVFKDGGSLLFGATWSSDSGDGPNEQCVFFSTTGEAAVYRGTNPGSAADWSLIGVYEVSGPLGQNATTKAGGDLLIATELGLVPISEAIRRDIAALSEGAASRKIQPYWQTAAQQLNGTDWQIAKWNAEGIMLVTQPGNSTLLVANLQSGAWSRFTGMDAQSVAVFGTSAYFGTSDGEIFKLQDTGADDGMPYTATYFGQFEGMGMAGIQKTVLQSRPTFISNTPINPKLTMNADYSETIGTAPNAAAFTATEGWDVSTWDVSLWDAGGTDGIGAGDSQWVAIGVTGYTHAPVLQLTFGNTVAPDVQYVGADYTMSTGALVA